MRVTDRMLFDQANVSIGQARDRQMSAANRASSGVKLEHPSDDPAGAGLVAVHRLAQKRQEAISQAATRASDELSAADSTLDSMNTILARASELAVQLANDTYSAVDRRGTAVEVGVLFKGAISLLNETSGDRYLFGGNLDGGAPFQPDGTYVGDTAVRKVELSPGVFQDSSVRADVALKGAGGGVDVLAALTALQTSLAANDVAGVRGTIEALATGITQVSTARAQVGAAQLALDAASMSAQAAGDDEMTQVAHLTDADPIQAATSLALAQRGLDASLSASAKSFQLTLLDKL